MKDALRTAVNITIEHKISVQEIISRVEAGVQAIYAEVNAVVI